MKKRILVSIVAITLCFVICVITSASTPVSVSSAYIDEPLKKIIETANDDELIPVDIWISEIDTTEVESAVMKKVGNTKESLSNAKSATHSLVDAYIEAERKIYAEMQSEKSQTFLDKHTAIFNSKTFKKEKLLYVSKYAPVISAKLTMSEINRLSKDLSVNAIYYAPTQTIENYSNVSIPLIRADFVRDTLSYSGTGIKIGMIERATPNPNMGYFTASNIIIDSNAAQNSDANDKAHANLVASIMVAKSTTVNGITYKGITPNAKLYATSAITPNQFIERVEWLLSQGVHVINMSAGWDVLEQNGIYDHRCKWFDHIAINHSVHFVCAAGDNGNIITIPSMAYNVISVGTLDDNNTLIHEDDSLHISSPYIEHVGLADKPDLVAPGTNITTAAGNNIGSSFAAPHVTATIAQLCQAYPTLKTKQDAMKAILLASIKHEKHAYTPSDEYWYDRFGAGVVDSRAALYTTENFRYVSSSFVANPDETMKTYYFDVTSSDTYVRIALAWLKYNRFPRGASHNDITSTSIINGTLPIVCLWIYDPDGIMITQSCLDYGNTQIADFVPTKYGTYKIEVELWSEAPDKTYFGLAWW